MEGRRLLVTLDKFMEDLRYFYKAPRPCVQIMDVLAWSFPRVEPIVFPVIV